MEQTLSQQQLKLALWALGYEKEAENLTHFAHNLASGRVLQKIGMFHEGHLRQHVRKGGEFIDLEEYGMFAGELKLGE